MISCIGVLEAWGDLQKHLWDSLQPSWDASTTVLGNLSAPGKSRELPLNKHFTGLQSFVTETITKPVSISPLPDQALILLG